jgi:hypothetical protein
MRPFGLISVVYLCVALAQAEAQSKPPLTTAQVAKVAAPATATILTLDARGDTVAQGSGFVIERTGVVVTNWHVLKGAAKAVIQFPSGEQFDWVRFLAGDSLADIVLLKFPAYDLPTLATSTVVPDPGNKVVVIGSPLGLSETVSEGIVSAVRVIDGRQLVQISAPVSHGSSGGPVLDEKARVFAVATSQLPGGQQLNFAVPIRYALALLGDHQSPRPIDSVFARAQSQAPAAPDAVLSDTVTAVLVQAKSLIDRRRPKEAVPLLEFAYANGDATIRENVAALLYTGAAPLLQQPQDLSGATELLRLAVKAASPAGKVAPAANYLLGLATLFQVPQIDPQAEKQKSCGLAKQEYALLEEAESALILGRSSNPDAVDKNLGIISKYKPRVNAMLRKYC